MLHPDVRLETSRIAGRGLIATAPIPLGSIVWHPCTSCRVLTAVERRALPRSEDDDLEELGYYLSDGNVLLPCRDACFMNHSCDAAVLDFGLEFGVAVRDLAAGDEVTCDYATFASDPPWLVHCRCGTPGCRSEIRPGGGTSGLRTQWRQRLAPALAQAGAMPQPLAPSLSASSRVFQAWQRTGRWRSDATASIRQLSFPHAGG